MHNAATIHAFAETSAAAARLSAALGIPIREIAVHRFPDGESLVRVDRTSESAIVYRSLDHPNDKLVEIVLAASALRDQGATRLILVAPYMCYMRQDTAFHSGEAVSQKVIGRLLDGLFDGIVTVDPHLHRTPDLAGIFPEAQTVSASATSLFAAQLRSDGVSADTLLVGPDRESRQWVEAVAQPLGLEVFIGEKSRRSDRGVDITIPNIANVKGRPAVIIDDVVSTGGTLIRCAKLLEDAGVASMEVLAVHALWGPEEEAALLAAGIFRLRSTDSIPHPSNTIHLAPLLADSLRGMEG
jgi:ribose-phosphate pyrophosphokinase